MGKLQKMKLDFEYKSVPKIPSNFGSVLLFRLFLVVFSGSVGWWRVLFPFDLVSRLKGRSFCLHPGGLGVGSPPRGV